MKRVIINESMLERIVREMLSEAKKKYNSPKDVVKAVSKANRDMDIEDHGKPTVFRPMMTKNPKAYSRKVKHKGGEPVDEGK